ncbi:MAG: LysR family transcriptional regulator, partial [Peptococcaceae bacterium]|nr:LysR family transcriptional regulator [Peptococcaceae bacterium]
MLQSAPLWYLIQVGNYQSLSIAAEQLHISQPSLSVAIKKLEKELGLQLLERTYRGVRLTADGEKVVELASKAFAYFDEI